VFGHLVTNFYKTYIVLKYN